MNNQNCCMNVGTEINYCKTKQKSYYRLPFCARTKLIHSFCFIFLCVFDNTHILLSNLSMQFATPACCDTFVLMVSKTFCFETSRLGVFIQIYLTVGMINDCKAKIKLCIYKAWMASNSSLHTCCTCGTAIP